MVLVSFADIGKSAKDIFTKHFKSDVVNFDYRSKLFDEDDLHIQCNVNYYTVTGKSEMTFRPVNGVSVKTSIDSNNQVTSDVQLNPELTGSQHNIIATIIHNPTDKSLLLKNNFKHENLNVELDMDFHSKYPQTTGSIAIGNKGLILGGQVVLEAEKLSIAKHTLCLQYAGKGYETYGSVTNAKDFECRFFQKIRNLSIGVMFGCAGALSNTTFGFASIYQINPNTFIKGKINQLGALFFAYGMKITPDVQMIVSLESNMGRFSSLSAAAFSFEISN